jgi:hypothetical protein
MPGYCMTPGSTPRPFRFYAHADSELQKLDILKIDAPGYASFLDEYVDSLQSAGLVERSAEVAARSAAIRQAHKGEAPKFSARYKA